MKLSRAFFLIAMLSLTVFPQSEFVAGTRVSLDAPQKFKAAAKFPGFEYAPFNASIVVNELPAPFSKISAGFSDAAALKARKMQVLSREDIMLDKRKAMLINLKQNALGTEFLKWIVIFGNEKETVLITAAFPKKYETQLSGELKASVLSAKWNEKEDVSITEGLNYAVEETADLKLAKRVTNSLIFSKNAVFPSKNIDDPIFVVSQSFSDTIIADEEKFSKQRILAVETVNRIKITKSEKIVIDELEGYEIFADAVDDKTGKPAFVYQVMLFEKGNYFIMLGIVSQKNKQIYTDDFRKMAESFRRK